MESAQSSDSDEATEGLESSERLEKVIEGFLQKHRFLHQYRLQKLVYLAELLYTERTGGDRLTDAEYRPYRYGAYSEDVKKELGSVANRPDVKAEHSRKYGNDTWTYKSDNVDPNLPKEVEEVVDLVMKLTRKKSNDELAQFSKSTHLFEETDYDSEMDFDEYIDHLETGNQPDWKKLV